MKDSRIRTALLLATLLLGAGGCAGGGGAPASAPATTAGSSASTPVEPSLRPTSTGPGMGSDAATSAAAAITITNFAYEVPASVVPGAEVTVTNMDDTEHTVTADQDSGFDVEVKENGGTATFIAPAQPGSYAFHCKYHSNMHGTLTVN
jgi:plastocyanin